MSPISINQIYNEDCLVTLMRMPDQFIDLTLTSPPYDNLRQYKAYTWNFQNVAKELYRVTKEGGVVVWIVGDATIKGSETGTSFQQALYFKEIGFNLHDTMIYEKSFFSKPHDNRYWAVFEYMFVFCKGRLKTANMIHDKPNTSAGRVSAQNTVRERNGALTKRSPFKIAPYGKRTNIWKYAIGYNQSSKDSEASAHPAIMPERLAQDHILSWSNEHDLVYDPFMGAGTTAKMCVLNNRQYIGSEICTDYCKIAEQRLAKVTCQGSLFNGAPA